MRDKIIFHAVPKWLRKLAATILALIIILPVLALFLYTVFHMDSNGCRGEYICDLLGVDDKRSAVELLGAALTTLGLGFLALWGLWVASRRAVAMEKTAQAQARGAEAQARGAEAQARGAEAQAETVVGDTERRIQERFRDAVKLLGHEKESVRLGGACALFHLAVEEESQRKSIAEILCAHIQGGTADKGYRDKYKNQPSTEIQFLMTLLFEERDANRSETLKRFWNGINPDLSGGFFRGIKLEKAQFQGARLNSTQFQKATLREARFLKAVLQGAQFQGADLDCAQFRETEIKNVQFQGAVLSFAGFQLSEIENVQFQGAILPYAGFQGASIKFAQFQGACLFKTGFQAAHFFKTKFHGCFSQAHFERERHGFQEQIILRANEPSDFRVVVFSGGLEPEDVGYIPKQFEDSMTDQGKLDLIKMLDRHVGQPASNTPPGPDDVTTGKYDKDKANQWIAEYKKAMN